MKTTKTSKTNAKSRIIFFFALAAYNLLLGVYLKDFLVLSPILVTLYLLSALPTLFFVLKIRSTPMRVIVLIVLFFVMVMSIVSALSWWDTQTEELADEICADSDTDAEKVQVIYNRMIANFEYDYSYKVLLQYFDVRRTLSTRKGVCYDFANLFAALCRSQNIPCYVVDGTPYDRATEDHTWNRVYYDGAWWDVDITSDIMRTQNNQELYSFRMLESVSASDKLYYITKIY